MIKSLLCWSVTLLMFTQTRHSLQPAARICDFEIFLAVFLKAHSCFDRPEYWMSAICISKLWNTAFCPRSHSTVSPQVMYKKYKRLVYTPVDLLARFCKDFGFQKRAVQLLYSYLHDRKYSVKLGSHVSTCRHVERSAVVVPRAPPLVRCCGISFRTIWTICLTA